LWTIGAIAAVNALIAAILSLIWAISGIKKGGDYMKNLNSRIRDYITEDGD